MDEYGIRYKPTGRIHRDQMTAAEAHVWMTDGWDDLNPHAVYEIVRRPIGSWEAAPTADAEEVAR